MSIGESRKDEPTGGQWGGIDEAILQEAGRDPETPWLIWTRAGEGLMAAWPTRPRHPRNMERIADSCANHSLNAMRYGVQ